MPPTINSINSTIPIEISKGGTNAASFSTATGIVKYDGTSLVTSTTATIDASNRMRNTAQPAFNSGIMNAFVNNITGDGTAYALVSDVERFDQNNNFNGTTTFTAPKTGKYLFVVQTQPSGLSSVFTYGSIDIVTTSATYRFLCNIGAAIYVNFRTISINALCPMTAGDTATFVLTVSGGTKVVDIQNSETNIFCSTLAC
jgi:hypothetical protein